MLKAEFCENEQGPLLIKLQRENLSTLDEKKKTQIYDIKIKKET